MKKVDLDTVESVLTDHIQDPKSRLQIVKDIEAHIEANKTPPSPKTKSKFLGVAVTDNKEFENVPLFIVQVPEGKDHTQVLDDLKTASINYNGSKKGSNHPVKTFGEAFENVTRKYFKEHEIQVKTKESILILTTENELDLANSNIDIDIDI